MPTETRRDQLEAAFDQLAEEPKDESTNTPSEEVVQTTTEDAKTDGTDDGRVSTEETGSKDEQRVEQEAANRQQPGKQKESGKPEGKVQEHKDAVRAPASWKGVERAEWAKIPRVAQEAIARREREVAKVLQDSAGHRQFTKQFLDVINPFAPLIRAQNSTPLIAVKNLMTTASGLSQGNASQKAMIIAEICSNYGVDVRELDKALGQYFNQDGTGKRGDFNAGTVNPTLTRELAPIQNFMSEIQQARAQRQAELQADADDEVAEWGQNRLYFDELREEMADYMEIASDKGKKMSLEKAYELALADHPEMKRVVDQKQRAAKQNGANSVEKARRASTSIVGNPNGSSEMTNNPVSRKDHLLAAWDKAAGK